MEIKFSGAPMRLDVFVSEQLTDLTRSHIKIMITEGKITVNGKSVKAGYMLKTGDEVFVTIEPPKTTEVLPEDISLDIVYQDSDFAIINKPKGMVVHPAVKNFTGTLVNALLYNIKDLSGINGEIRPGIVHRLDKDTTGLMVVAKNDKAHVALSKQIATKECFRYYYALTEGHFKEDGGEIITNISRSKKNRLKMAVSDEGKYAHTLYKVLKRYNKFDFVEFELKTGRTHQIRVHCEHMRHPIVGDELYGSKSNKLYSYGQFLHAHKLVLTHPTTKERMQFEAPLPEYFEKFIQSLN